MDDKKPRLLDLFCGAGGATMGYHRAGFEVIGVDINPQLHYPFEFHQADALEFPLEGYDAYHASPPCQAYSDAIRMVEGRAGRKLKADYPDLIEPVRKRLLETRKPYVIENVKNAPLNINLMLCGTQFGLRIIRHRFFEAPWYQMQLLQPCNHADVYDPWHEDWLKQKEKMLEAMKIDWIMTRPEVREAIPPAYTEYIGKYLLEAVNSRRAYVNNTEE